MTTPQMKAFLIALLTATNLLSSSKANATSRFPSAIYYHLLLPYMPPCSLCHARGSTGPGTAQTPFALSAQARGMIKKDNNSLTAALDAMDRDAVDSDGDGVPDIQELRDDTNPNTPANVSLSGTSGPNAGCGGGSTGRSPNAYPAFSLVLLLLPLLRRRRRQS